MTKDNQASQSLLVAANKQSCDRADYFSHDYW